MRTTTHRQLIELRVRDSSGKPGGLLGREEVVEGDLFGPRSQVFGPRTDDHATATMSTSMESSDLIPETNDLGPRT